MLPDWSRVAADVEAVHLTMAGYLTTAGRAVSVTDGMSTALAGWAPDATVWLGDPPADDASAERRWSRTDDRWTSAPGRAPPPP